MTLQHLDGCKDVYKNLPANVEDLKIVDIARNAFQFNGNFVTTKELRGPLELHLVITKCNQERTGCQLIDKIVFINVCDKIYDRKTFWSEVTKVIEPKLKCPLPPGIYNFNNGTIDLSIFAKMPLVSFGLWIIQLTIVQIDDKKKKNTVVFCTNADMMITSSKKRTKKN